MSAPSPVAAGRRLQALHDALGPAVREALADPEVVEVLANPDGRIVVDRQGEGRRALDAVLSADARDRVVRLVADHVGAPVSPADPRVCGVLPGAGERFQGFLPPISAGPTFAIRKRAGRIWTLDDYVAGRVLDDADAASLREAVAARRNLLVSGGTGSGKTTLANALLAEPGFASDRVFLIEDTPELQCAAADQVAVLTRRVPRPIGVADLVRDALRMRPDRIVVGEMRDGAAALETLKAWNTGHPGGLSTLHANSAAEALYRLEDLIAEATAVPPTRLIRQAVDLVIQIERGPAGRRVVEILAPRRP